MAGNSGKVAASSLSVTANEFSTINKHIIKKSSEGDELFNYVLMVSAYKRFEDPRFIITRKANPDTLYETILKLHQKLCKLKGI